MRPEHLVVVVVVATLQLLVVVGAGSSEPPPPWERRLHCPPAEGVGVRGRVDSRARVSALIRQMQAPGVGVDAYVVTDSDQHQSEFVAACDRRRSWLSGFTGSLGVAVVTSQRGGLSTLWTDGRYHAQADVQLDCGWLLARHGEVGVPSPGAWLRAVLPPGARVGADPRTTSHEDWAALERDLSTEGNSTLVLVPTEANLADLAWGAVRPSRPAYPAEARPLALAGEAWESKAARLREQLSLRDADACLLSRLDDVAWTLNLRGHDLPYLPVLRAFLLVERRGSLRLYADGRQLDDASVRAQLRVHGCHGGDACVTLRPYAALLEDLAVDAQRWRLVLLAGASHAVAEAVPHARRDLGAAPVAHMKAEKNEAEARGLRHAHVKDAAALCSFLAYMEVQTQDPEDSSWDELYVADTVDSFRGEKRGARGPSFPTIAAFSQHSAQPHYRPDNLTKLMLNRGDGAMLLLDSGGQYEDGTTDVTRTFHLGTPTAFQREVYTRVLAASIQLATLVFPDTLRTSEVEVLTRGPLWEAGLDYDHGSGHGIGAYLSVHEAPVTLGRRDSNETFHPGYFFTDEPGCYRVGEFGVRLENVLEVVRHEPHVRSGSSSSRQFLALRPVTLVPYEPKLIDVDRLTPPQRRWLNDYNAQIRHKVGAELKKQRDMRAFHWMMANTGYIPELCPKHLNSGAQSPYKHPTPLLHGVAAVLLVFHH